MAVSRTLKYDLVEFEPMTRETVNIKGYILSYEEVEDGKFDVIDKTSINLRRALYISETELDDLFEAAQSKDESTIDSILNLSEDCTDSDFRRYNSDRLDRGDYRTISEVVGRLGYPVNL